MRAHGQYTLWTPAGKKLILPNVVTDEGVEATLKMAFQNNESIVAGGANFYVGICNDANPTAAYTLTDITDEPSGAGSYARQSFARNTTGVPTVGKVNGVYRFASAVLTFAASGAAFDQTLSRLFMTSASSGTSGTLFSVSEALPAAITVADGESYSVQYEMYLQ